MAFQGVSQSTQPDCSGSQGHFRRASKCFRANHEPPCHRLQSPPLASLFSAFTRPKPKVKAALLNSDLVKATDELKDSQRSSQQLWPAGGAISISLSICNPHRLSPDFIGLSAKSINSLHTTSLLLISQLKLYCLHSVFITGYRYNSYSFLVTDNLRSLHTLQC